MLPKKEWAKITKALDNGTLKLKVLTDAEFEAIEQRHKKITQANPEYRQAEKPALLTQ